MRVTPVSLSSFFRILDTFTKEEQKIIKQTPPPFSLPMSHKFHHFFVRNIIEISFNFLWFIINFTNNIFLITVFLYILIQK